MSRKKTQNRINSAVTIVVQTTLFQVQNHKNKVIFSNPNSANQLGQAQKLQKQNNPAVNILVLSTLAKYKITQNELILQQPYYWCRPP